MNPGVDHNKTKTVAMDLAKRIKADVKRELLQMEFRVVMGREI